MKKLHISDGLSLPIDAVTQTFAILAVKGSGKSYTASVNGEEMLKANQQIVVIDITGAWYGLKSSSDGKSEGFPIAVFGGDHADVPLQEHAGEIIAQAIVEKRFSAILDLSLFRKGQVIRFLGSFLETLYRLNRNPLHLFADECDAYIPQKVFGEQARTVGAMEDIVRRGRKKGIGCSLISQRPASINKDVLTQCEVLIALRMVHPRDIDAIKEWVNVHSSIDQAKDMIASLPSLPTGTAYVWSPSWLNIFKKIVIRHRDTFDSGATPKPGQEVKVPKKLAFIDIKKLGEEIEQTVEKSKADDPRELRKQIAELKKQISITVTPVVQKEGKVKEVPVIKDSQIKKYEKILVTLENMANKHGAALALLWSNLDEQAKALLGALQQVDTHQKWILNKSIPQEPPRSAPQRHPRIQSAPSGNTDLPVGEKKILSALIQFPNGLERKQLTVLAQYKQSARDTYISRLSQKGYVTVGAGKVIATQAGIDALPDFQPLPTGEALQAHWLSVLPLGEKKILQLLIDSYPGFVSRNKISEDCGYKQSARDTYISRMTSKELIKIAGPGLVVASENLFE